MSELKQCPFCGGKASIENDGFYRWAECQNIKCEASARVFAFVHDAGSADNIVADNWNTRPLEDALLKRAEAAEAEVARLTAKLQSAKSEVDEILRAALSGDYDRYLNYDLQGNKYCKWGVVSKDIAAVFDVTEPSDIDVSKQGFND